MSDEPVTLSPLAQAVSELSIMEASIDDVVTDLAEDFGEVVLLADGAAAVAAARMPPDVAAHAALAAMIGMGLGVRAERVRQRRDGDHPGEAVSHG